MKTSNGMKICFLTRDIDPKSGWGRYAGEVVKRVKEAGMEVEILTEEKSDEAGTEKAVLKSGLPRPLSFFVTAFNIRKFIKDCDIVHALDGWPYGVIAAIALTGLRKKFVISGVGTYSVLPLYQKKNAGLLRLAYKKADKILCISNFTCNEIKKKIALKNLEVVNLGVDSEKFGICPKKPARKEKIILSVGALKFRKGYHISIPAVGEAAKIYPDIKYFIVGDQSNKEYFEKLKGLVRENSLGGRVEFLSGISDEKLAELYCACDLFLLPSVVENHSFEGFGLVYLEANAFGKPAIGTLDCGAEDAIKNGYSGFLVPQNDINATSGAILKILDNEPLRQEMGKNALDWAKKNDWESVVDKYKKVYDEII